MDNFTTDAPQGAGDLSGTLSAAANAPETSTNPGDALAVALSAAGIDFTVPDYIPELPSWKAVDYATTITGSGADKLADSGVAPLVAAARGYLRLDASNWAVESKTMQVKANSKQGRRLRDTIQAANRDGMQMPWYSVADIQIAHRDGTKAAPFTYQVRPAVPELNEHGKPIKYEFISSVGTPLDVHPATPVDWIDNTPVVMFAEGMLKGDSALSAYLHANGVSYDELRSAGVTNPAAKLRELLEAIPAENRILIVSIAGIWNTHQNPIDWREIKLKDREGWIAFDADTGINPHVHAAAFKLSEALKTKSKMEPVKFLAPLIPSDDDGTLAKAGVDDYLAKHGTWEMLLKGLQSKLPDAPPRSENEFDGAVRVSKDGYSVEECKALHDGPGGSIGNYVWSKVVDLGGRISSLEAVRQPTEDEMRKGIFDPRAGVHDAADSMVEIEVAWETGGTEHKAVIQGPETILHYAPADWVRQKAIIPTELLRHPSWPPRAAKGEAWLSAVKAHRSAETTQRTSWEQMGWVPVDGGEPVFLIGDQIVGEMPDGAAVCGIDERDVPTMPMFGVGDMLEGDLDDPEYRDMVRKDFRDVIDAYITSGAWTEKGTAALVLGAALRPVIPLRPRATVFLWGPKGKGKSWTAKTMMYFWARRRANWQDQLPGSAKDTVAYIEHCVARTPIWVVDDLAPSPVKRQAESEDGKLADLTRSIFNNATKGRMNADMSSRKVNKPIAQLVITAENELTTPSAKERLIPAYLGHGKLSPSKEPTTRLNTMSKEDGTQARFTSHLIRYVRHKATTTPGGWEAYYGRLEDMRSTIQGQAEKIMSRMGATAGSLERTSSLAADILITFEVLNLFARELDMEREFTKIFHIKDGIGMDLITLVCNAHVENLRSSPGTSLVRALSALLASGGAHVISADDPTRPPVEGTDENESMTNHRLGWSVGSSEGALKPNGPVIGTVVTKGGQRIILFDKETAFYKAQDAFSNLIQHGQGTASAWASIWDEGLSPAGIKREANRSGTLLTTIRVALGKDASAKLRSRISGVPISVETILNAGLADGDFEDEVD
jgi:hypothetical protein